MRDLNSTITTRRELAAQGYKRASRLLTAAFTVAAMLAPVAAATGWLLWDWAQWAGLALLLVAHTLGTLLLLCLSLAATGEADQHTIAAAELDGIALKAQLASAELYARQAEINACPHACADRSCHNVIVNRRADAVAQLPLAAAVPTLADSEPS